MVISISRSHAHVTAADKEFRAEIKMKWGIECKNGLTHVEKKLICPISYDLYSLLEYIIAINSISQRNVTLFNYYSSVSACFTSIG